MEHLSNETIKKFINGEYPYSMLLEISTHLLSCPNICRKNLDKIDPNFLVMSETLENERIKVISGELHFSQTEIEDFVTRKIEINRRNEMNQHFIKCPICSRKLKELDPDYLSNFIKDSLNKEEQLSYTVQSENNGFQFRMLVPVAAFSLILLVFLVVILTLPNNKSNDQAKLDEFSSSNISTELESNTQDNKIPNTNGNNSSETTKDSSTTYPQPSSKNLRVKSASASQPNNLTLIQKRQNQEKTIKKQEIIVKNRSLGNNCENNPELAITPKDEIITEIQPTLTWKSLPKAKNYKIYLSDDENNLIEESNLEGKENTSYKLTNKLRINKKYEWKVVITLEEGKEVYGESAYFSIGEKAKKFIHTKSKPRINEVRCLKPQN